MSPPVITMHALREKRVDILRLADRWGARNVRVFGSVARGDNPQPGDVDFLVDFAPDRSLLDHGGFLNDLEILLGVLVDVVSERGLRPRFRERVLQEATPL
ncbi:putative nucleotidyltransferase [Thioflavicoccus mobilis 8321]|uniref:Putative nucleotidyltransferase n=1 Tax=Thioflavicoccus mobilis 8321 TaxID=765912 RepID=L0H1C1_9GAMM|nr:nucleotidyltransferase family protein [Thioflavicoccus mobilis]AGA91435.1 putative nucleotidyltransferase [Thioflavicoccus mobilis 8321]